MTKVLVSTAIWLGLLAAVVPASASQDLIKKYGCVACHATDKKLVGPSFKDISSKYKSKSDAVTYLTNKIKVGGAGVWGPIPMPAQAHVSEADRQAMAKWILTN